MIVNHVNDLLKLNQQLQSATLETHCQQLQRAFPTWPCTLPGQGRRPSRQVVLLLPGGKPLPAILYQELVSHL